jgi:hypothetical protein
MYQKLIIVGNLGKDPEMRYAPNGDAVTNLNVATNRKYTDKGGQVVKETTWFRVSVWGKQAEACNTYLKKKVLRFLNQSHIKALYHRVEKDDKNFGRVFVHFKF